jgi:hypothetical protein
MSTESPPEVRTVLVGAPGRSPHPGRLDRASSRPEPQTVWLTASDRIDEALQIARTSPTAWLGMPGAEVAVRAVFEILPGSARSARTLIARPQCHVFDAQLCQPGATVAVRFSDASGVYDFQTLVLGARGGVVLLASPVRIGRLSRRAVPRCAVPPERGVVVRLPLTDGTIWETSGVRDLSTYGLRIALPTNVHFPLGRPAAMGLILHAEHGLALQAVARNMSCDDSTGETLYGLELLDASAQAHRAIERFIGRVQQAAVGAIPGGPPPYLGAPTAAPGAGRRFGGLQ